MKRLFVCLCLALLCTRCGSKEDEPAPAPVSEPKALEQPTAPSKPSSTEKEADEKIEAAVAKATEAEQAAFDEANDAHAEAERFKRDASIMLEDAERSEQKALPANPSFDPNFYDELVKMRSANLKLANDLHAEASKHLEDSIRRLEKAETKLKKAKERANANLRKAR